MPERARTTREIALRAKQLADSIIHNLDDNRSRIAEVRGLITQAEEMLNAAYIESFYSLGATTLTITAKPLHFPLAYLGFRASITTDIEPSTDITYQDAQNHFPLAQHALAAAEFLIAQDQRHHHDLQIMEDAHNTALQISLGNYESIQHFNMNVAIILRPSHASIPPSLFPPQATPPSEDVEEFVLLGEDDLQDPHEA